MRANLKYKNRIYIYFFGFKNNKDQLNLQNLHLQI